jgi:hypothetical protein
MTDYGVPVDPEGALARQWAEERLLANRNYWVVTASPVGRPSAMPVWGVWLVDEQQFWFSTSANSRKARNLAVNERCAVTIDDTVECVSLEGRARRVEPDAGAEGFDAMLASYLAKYWPDPAVHAEMEQFLRSHAVFVVVPERAFGIIERDDEFASRATRWRW